MKIYLKLLNLWVEYRTTHGVYHKNLSYYLETAAELNDFSFFMKASGTE